MGTQKVKAIELIFDWNLWPRHKAEVLDVTNLNQLKDALRAGFKLPPVIISKNDMRIVDGFHRTKAVLDVFGEDAEIEAELRIYKNDAEMFLEAGALNIHGLKMSPMDRAHFIIRCKKFKIPPAQISAVLGLDIGKMKQFINQRSAKTKDGETIPLPGGARNLAGKTLTRDQEHFARSGSGLIPIINARILINSLKADAMTLDETAIKVLTELYSLIGSILEGV